MRGLPPPPAPGQPPPQQFQGMQQQNLYQQQPQHQHHLYASHYPQQGKPPACLARLELFIEAMGFGGKGEGAPTHPWYYPKGKICSGYLKSI